MFSDNHGEFKDDAASGPDEWEEFRDGDSEPISLEALKRLNLKEMPEDVSVWVMGSYFPDTTLTRDGEFLILQSNPQLHLVLDGRVRPPE